MEKKEKNEMDKAWDGIREYMVKRDIITEEEAFKMGFQELYNAYVRVKHDK